MDSGPPNITVDAYGAFEGQTVQLGFLHQPVQWELFPNLALSGSAAPPYSSAQPAMAALLAVPEHRSTRHSIPRTTPPDALGDELIAQVLHLLTKLVGPIAPILVTKARKRAADFHGFCAEIAERLDGKERRQFLEGVDTLQRTRGLPSRPRQPK
jgi:hypothetical protein